jgi:hypothetical protein
MKTERIYYQECDGQLLNVYRYNAESDEINLSVGDKINDTSVLTPYDGCAVTTIRRIQ